MVTGSLIPFAVLLWHAARGELGANPIATAMNQLGLLALVFLCASLACTPLKILFDWKWPIRVRKTLGLFAFFTALAHFLVYLVLDQVLVLPAIVADVLERPFIAVGFTALLLMVPLALTSTKNALQRLGPKRWKRLHRLAYVAGGLAIVHYVLRVKADLHEPLVYGAILAAFFAVRAIDAVRSRQRS